MAKQVGPLFVTGTIDGIIFYKLGNQYYMRSKGSYKSGKQMRKDPSYKRTMQNAYRFGEASEIVKSVYYRHLPKAVRKHGLFGKLTGLVNRWLYAGKAEAAVRELLLAHCQKLTAAANATKEKPSGLKPMTIATQPVSTHKPRTVIERHYAPTEQQSPVNVQRITPNIQQPSRRVKQARYLSKWKVKRNGRLQVPNQDASRLLTVKPISCHPELVSGSDIGNSGITYHKASPPLSARQINARATS